MNDFPPTVEERQAVMDVILTLDVRGWDDRTVRAFHSALCLPMRDPARRRRQAMQRRAVSRILFRRSRSFQEALRIFGYESLEDEMGAAA